MCAVCRRMENKLGGGIGNSRPAGHFGDYNCDSPWALVESAAKAMRSKHGDNIEFVLWTGWVGMTATVSDVMVELLGNWGSAVKQRLTLRLLEVITEFDYTHFCNLLFSSISHNLLLGALCSYLTFPSKIQGVSLKIGPLARRNLESIFDNTRTKMYWFTRIWFPMSSVRVCI